MSREVRRLTGRGPGKEISQAIRQLCMDIALLKRQKWPKVREVRDAAMTSALWEFHIKHTGHTRDLFTFPVGTRHQFNQAKGTKTINRDNTDIAKPPWLRATLSTRLSILTHHQLPNPGQQHTAAGVTRSSSQAMPTAPGGCEPKQSAAGCPWTPPDTLHSPNAPMLQEVSTPSRGTALDSLNPINCTRAAVLGRTKVCAWFT